RCRNVEGDKLIFIRSKTEKTSYSPKPIVVYLNEYSKGVLDKYGNPDQPPNDYVFPIFNHNLTPEKQRSKKNAFTRFINQHFLTYANNLGIKEKVSSYWARHSFSTIAIQKGLSFEFVGEALGHTDMKTTMSYFAGFEDAKKKDISNMLLEF
ncbi:unnamed protein product, partial [marine sediment metagenome]